MPVRRPRAASLRRKIIFVAGAALLVCLAIWFWPRDSSQPLLRLVVVRRIIESGKPVVVFRVKVADGRRLQIGGACRIINGKPEWPSQTDPTWGGLWTVSHGSPLGDGRTGRNEFYVCEPTNATVWQMRVNVEFEEPSFFKRLSYMPDMYRNVHRIWKQPVLLSARAAWGTFYSAGQQQLESELITNTMGNAQTLNRPKEKGEGRRENASSSSFFFLPCPGLARRLGSAEAFAIEPGPIEAANAPLSRSEHRAGIGDPAHACFRLLRGNDPLDPISPCNGRDVGPQGPRLGSGRERLP